MEITIDELRLRMHRADVDGKVLHALGVAVTELCCQYASADATVLRRKAVEWLRWVGTALSRPVGGPAAADLTVAAGWLSLLIGCLDYDLGRPDAAEAARMAAQRAGLETGHCEIVAWTHEMAAWFALTQGRYAEGIVAARAGRALRTTSGVHAQLIAHEAKARARLGDSTIVAELLDGGRRNLDRLPAQRQLNHHFVVDPAKWNLFAMDVFRVAGDHHLAERHARLVIADADRSSAPMRRAEAQLTLAALATRRGDLDAAIELGESALSHSRRSLPSLRAVARDLDVELAGRFPTEPGAAELRKHLRTDAIRRRSRSAPRQLPA